MTDEKLTVNIVDSIMGSGKTSAAINYIKKTDDIKIMYITPYIEEVERIKEACKNKNFVEPIKYTDNTPKIVHLKELLNKEDITLEEYEIFIERIIEERGVRTVASAHNITMKEVKHIVKNTIELLKVKYKMLFPDTYEVVNNSYNKN